MKRNKDWIILLADSVFLLTKRDISHINRLAEAFEILIIGHNEILPIRSLFKYSTIKKYLWLKKNLSKKIHLLIPIGILPLQRIRIVHTFNMLFLIIRYSLYIKHNLGHYDATDQPILYLQALSDKITAHWLYYPGLFNEKIIVYDRTRLDSNTSYKSEDAKLYEQDLYEIADAIFENDTSSRKGRSYKMNVYFVKRNQNPTDLMETLVTKLQNYG